MYIFGGMEKQLDDYISETRGETSSSRIDRNPLLDYFNQFHPVSWRGIVESKGEGEREREREKAGVYSRRWGACSRLVWDRVRLFRSF